MVSYLIFIIASLSCSVVVEAKLKLGRKQQKAAVLRAIRPDAPSFIAASSPAACGGCADNLCDTRGIGSFLEVIQEEMVEGFIVLADLIDNSDAASCSCVQGALDETLSAVDAVTSDLDALSAFEQTCCANTASAFTAVGSDIDALTRLQASSFDVTTSSVNYVRSDLDALSVFEQTCCANTKSSFDVVSSQIDALCTCCQFMITQDMVGSGGTYIIETAGIYCLAEDIQFSTGPAITISAAVDQVILDLNGHTISQIVNFRAPSTSAITVSNPSGFGSAIIRNGAISNAYMEITASNNIVVQDIQINTPDGIGLWVTGSANVLLERINIRDGVNDGIALSGSAHIVLDTITIYNCAGNGVSVSGSADIIFDNVKSAANSSEGFLVNGATAYNLTFKDCWAESNEGHGFALITDFTTNRIYSVLYENCVASDNINGGFYASADLGDIDIVSISYVNYINCTSRGGQTNGFYTSGGFPVTVIKNLVYEGCRASGAGGAGFYTANQGIIIQNCIAESNIGNGILLDNFSVGCQVIGNSVAGNGNVGIVDFGTNNLVYSNVSSGNVGTNYSAAVPLQFKPGSSTSYWINVDPNGPLGPDGVLP